MMNCMIIMFLYNRHFRQSLISACTMIWIQEELWMIDQHVSDHQEWQVWDNRIIDHWMWSTFDIELWIYWNDDSLNENTRTRNQDIAWIECIRQVCH